MTSHLRVLRGVALVTWLLVGLPVLIRVPLRIDAFVTWLVAFCVLGISIGMTFRGEAGLPVLHLALQAACVIVMVRVLCNGYEGALLVLVAMQLGLLVTRREGLLWI